MLNEALMGRLVDSKVTIRPNRIITRNLDNHLMHVGCIWVGQNIRSSGVSAEEAHYCLVSL